MSQPAVDELYPDAVEWAHEMYRAGDLRWKQQDHQLRDYDDFREWNDIRQTREHIASNRKRGAKYHRIWVDEEGRRTGKTAKWLLIAEEEMIRRRGCRGLIYTPKATNIGSIIVPLTRILFADAPPGYFPEYHTAKDGQVAGLFVPETGSFCELRGVDVNPDGTRGQYLDFAIGTEAAFCKNLFNLVTAVIAPTFSRRPWAWHALESSTAKQPDHEFNTKFREDARARVWRGMDGVEKAPYRLKTIEDNTSLTPEEIEIELDEAGGRDSPKAQREYFCNPIRDPEGTVVPEYDDIRHVVQPYATPVPQFALCYTVMDPGQRDPLGILWAYDDFERGKLVIQADFAEMNASVGKAARVIRETESALWWVQHRPPGHTDVPMLSIRDATRTAGGLVWEAPKPSLVYWDAASEEFLPNPYRRMSDVGAQLTGDLHREHALNFEMVIKDDPEAMLNSLRLAFTEDKIEIWANCHNLRAQLRSGMWNEKRTDWDRTPTLGHLDCVACLLYLWRNRTKLRNPAPPKRIDTALHDIAIPLGIDKDTATGRPHTGVETRFRHSSGERKWR